MQLGDRVNCVTVQVFLLDLWSQCSCYAALKSRVCRPFSVCNYPQGFYMHPPTSRSRKLCAYSTRTEAQGRNPARDLTFDLKSFCACATERVQLSVWLGIVSSSLASAKMQYHAVDDAEDRHSQWQKWVELVTDRQKLLVSLPQSLHLFSNRCTI